jgi:hypothetical protein
MVERWEGERVKRQQQQPQLAKKAGEGSNGNCAVEALVGPALEDRGNGAYVTQQEEGEDICMFLSRARVSTEDVKETGQVAGGGRKPRSKRRQAGSKHKAAWSKRESYFSRES